MTAFRCSKVVVTRFALELGIEQLYISARIATSTLFPMLLGLYAGKLTDRLDVRKPMIAGTLGVASALLVQYVWPGVGALFVSACLIGAMWVFYNVCAQNIMGILSDPEARAKN